MNELTSGVEPDAHREISRLSSEVAHLTSALDHATTQSAELLSALMGCGLVYRAYLALGPDVASPGHAMVLEAAGNAEVVANRALLGGRGEATS